MDVGIDQARQDGGPLEVLHPVGRLDCVRQVLGLTDGNDAVPFDDERIGDAELRVDGDNVAVDEGRSVRGSESAGQQAQDQQTEPRTHAKSWVTG